MANTWHCHLTNLLKTHVENVQNPDVLLEPSYGASCHTKYLQYKCHINAIYKTIHVGFLSLSSSIVLLKHDAESENDIINPSYASPTQQQRAPVAYD